ncbi:MAG: glyoxalase [Burkholderiaceae bacterium]|jgi:predicted enzyme related to lactoylglutathione lyase
MLPCKQIPSRLASQSLKGYAVILATAVLLVAPAVHAGDTEFAVGPQYDTTHVLVDPAQFESFVNSFTATFGGSPSPAVTATITPTPSSTFLRYVWTPVGTLSVFGFTTPVPYPFGLERTGYLVTNLDDATKAAKAAGASVIVSNFPDPIGRDVIIQWPGGVNMQLYWHFTPPNYSPLQTIPENRVYVAPDRADEFVRDFVSYSHGKVVSDVQAPGIEIGRTADTYRRIRVESKFGKMVVLVTDGHLPYPFGRELTGYEVPDLADTLAKAAKAGATILVGPFTSDRRDSVLVQFPGGYIAEIHDRAEK